LCGYFWDGVSWTICLGWLWTTILLLSSSWVARLTGVHHQHPASTNNFLKINFISFTLQATAKTLPLFYLNWNIHFRIITYLLWFLILKG
jgi:hypothetical protein